MRLKLLVGAAAGGLMCAAMTPALALPGIETMPKEPAPKIVPVQWVGAYQNPDGSYRSYTDFYRSLEGVPCGIQCRRDAARAWGYYPESAPPWYHR